MQKHVAEYCSDECENDYEYYDIELDTDDEFEEDDIEDDEFEEEDFEEEKNWYYILKESNNKNIKEEEILFDKLEDAVLYVRKKSLKNIDPISLKIYFNEDEEPVNISYFNGKIKGKNNFSKVSYIIIAKEI